MVNSSLGKYKLLMAQVANWPAYFWLKWFNKSGTAHFRLRRSGAILQVNATMLPVFKEVFMRDGYDEQFLNAHLPNGAVVLDVGANIGLFAAYVANLQPLVHIHCFEPLPENALVLRQNATACPAFAAAITVVPAALTGGHSASISFYADASKPFSQTASTIPGFLNNNDCITVPAVQLSNYTSANGISCIHLLKLDCEGSEYDILYDANPQVLAMVQALIVETHFVDTDTRNFEAMQTFLNAAGFRILNTHDVGDGLHLTWAVRPSAQPPKLT
jgi:FkbM family methyltransferase